jgi:steroid delta-isomerase-like uncharacterized protein
VSDDITRLVERHWKAWSTQDLEGILASFADDGVIEDLALDTSFDGKEGIRAMALRIFAAIPDLEWTPRRICVGDDSVAVEWNMTGTHQGDLPRIGPGTGKRFDVDGMTIQMLRGGLVRRQRDFWNISTYRRQVGLD